MRVLWWTYDFWPAIGGGEVLGAELIRGLQAMGYPLAVVTQQSGKELPERSDFHGIPVARFPFHDVLQARDPARIAGLQTRLKDLVRKFQPDLVHLHTLAYPAFFCERAISVWPARLLVTRHEYFHSTPQEDVLAAQVLASADWVACCSRGVLEEVRRLVPGIARRSSTILNGLAPPGTPPTSPPMEPPVLLCLGRLTDQKGFDLAIAALARLRTRCPRSRLIVAGDGPARDALKERALHLGVADRVQFLGWVAPPRVPETLRRATVVLVPSRGGEAFGLVALQAAQMARPVVAARTGGLPEVVADGKTGLLFDPDDAEGLAAAVGFLLERPEAITRYGLAGRERALERFSGQRYLEEYHRLYQRLGATGSTLERSQGRRALPLVPETD